MAKYKFEARLETKSLDKLVQDLENYRKSLDLKVDQFAKLLADYGVRIAQNNIVDLNAVFTHELLNSMRSERGTRKDMESVWFVVADSEHAYFVEVGTGIVGATGPIYKGYLSANYMSGKYIHLTKNNKYGWYYQNANGEWRFTEGMPSRPFMFNTSNELITMINKVAKEVFG